MRSNGFFAFELFGEQERAVQILSLNVFFNFLIVVLYLFAAALLWAAKAGKVAIIFGFLASLFTVVLFSAVAISSGRYELFVSILFFCAVLGLYLYILDIAWVPRKGTALVDTAPHVSGLASSAYALPSHCHHFY